MICNLIFNKKFKTKDKTIYFKPEFDEKIDYNLCKYLTKFNKIVFIENEMDENKYYFMRSSNFNQSVNNLPLSIKEIIFGYKFNCEVNKLPALISKIKFGTCFNQSVNNLPPLLKELNFGDNFNQPVNNLPRLIENLEFGLSFNQSVNKLPIFIKNLNLSGFFHKSINKLPNSIIELRLGEYYKNKIKRLPDNLEYLIFNYNSRYIHPIPFHDKLKYLKVGKNFKQKINFNNNLHTLGYCFPMTDKNIPYSIKSLCLYDNNQNILDNLPNTIEELEFELDFTSDDELELNNLPNSIKKINLKEVLIPIILDNLPESVEHILLPKFYELEINKLPSNIKIIECNKNYKFVKSLKKNKKIKVIFYKQV